MPVFRVDKSEKNMTPCFSPIIRRSRARRSHSERRDAPEHSFEDENATNDLCSPVLSRNEKKLRRRKWNLPVDTVSSGQSSILGLVSSSPINVVLDYYSDDKYGPCITISQANTDGLTWKCAHDPVALSTECTNERFRVGIALIAAVKSLVACYWWHRRAYMFRSLPTILEERLNSCGEHCMLCDDPLAVPGVEPTICDNLHNDVRMFMEDPVVADLLVSFAVAAGNAPPSREFARPKVPHGLFGHRESDGRSVAKVLNKIPRVEAFQYSSAEQVAALLRKVRGGALPLCNWLFGSTRAHVMLLPESKRLAVMNTPCQFHVRTTRQSHDINHANGRTSHFAFHISPFGNWHNILRQGLLNLSGTPQSQSGKHLYGRGIYLSKNTSVCIEHLYHLSSIYHPNPVAETVAGWDKSLFGTQPYCLAICGTQPYCLAICEVAEGPGVKFPASAGRVIVAKDPRSVTLRYLFVYRDLKSMPVDVDTSLPEVERFCQLQSVDER